MVHVDYMMKPKPYSRSNNQNHVPYDAFVCVSCRHSLPNVNCLHLLGLVNLEENKSLSHSSQEKHMYP